MDKAFLIDAGFDFLDASIDLLVQLDDRVILRNALLLATKLTASTADDKALAAATRLADLVAGSRERIQDALDWLRSAAKGHFGSEPDTPEDLVSLGEVAYANWQEGESV